MQKVTAFITRQRRHTSELLLFRHPLAGTQVPAGTVEEGEGLEAALRREVREETGLEVAGGRHLGFWENELADNERVTRRVVPLLEAAAADAAEMARIGRGVSMPFFGERGAFSEVRYQIIEDGGVSLRPARGWVETTALSATKERHFYHVPCVATTPDSWKIKGDQGLVYDLFWAPFAPKPLLVTGQDRWLDFVWPALHRLA